MFLSIFLEHVLVWHERHRSILQRRSVEFSYTQIIPLFVVVVVVFVVVVFAYELCNAPMKIYFSFRLRSVTVSCLFRRYRMRTQLAQVN